MLDATMIATGRKSLSSLLLSPNSALCNSNIHFSIWSLKRLSPSPEIYDVLVHKHNFSPESASLASSRLYQFRSPERVDSTLSFLKENSFTTTQLEKLVLYNPRVLGVSVEVIKSRLRVFQDLGLSSPDIAKILMANMAVLQSSMANMIVPSLSKLKGLLPSNHDVAKLLKSNPRFLTTHLERSIMPNIEILQSYGIPKDRVLYFLHIQSWCFWVKPGIMRKSIEKAIEIGIPRSSISFIKAVSVFTSTSEGIWEIKLQTLQDLGFSENDIFTMFRKAPSVFFGPTTRMKNVIELLLANGKYNISNIVNSPVSLGYSIEKRLEPRLHILGLLESRNLLKKWPSISVMARSTDDIFFDRFIRPHMDEIGKEYMVLKYVDGKKR